MITNLWAKNRWSYLIVEDIKQAKRKTESKSEAEKCVTKTQTAVVAEFEKDFFKKRFHRPVQGMKLMSKGYNHAPTTITSCWCGMHKVVGCEVVWEDAALQLWAKQTKIACNKCRAARKTPVRCGFREKTFIVLAAGYVKDSDYWPKL